MKLGVVLVKTWESDRDVTDALEALVLSDAVLASVGGSQGYAGGRVFGGPNGFGGYGTVATPYGVITWSATSGPNGFCFWNGRGYTNIGLGGSGGAGMPLGGIAY